MKWWAQPRPFCQSLTQTPFFTKFEKGTRDFLASLLQIALSSVGFLPHEPHLLSFCLLVIWMSKCRRRSRYVFDLVGRGVGVLQSFLARDSHLFSGHLTGKETQNEPPKIPKETPKTPTKKKYPQNPKKYPINRKQK